ncbi:MAG: terminase large subunit [Ancalomicrobiaceae bacterium]|nr:terminase large subunit [Ancalomicrobiaceae bacterium]
MTNSSAEALVAAPDRTAPPNSPGDARLLAAADRRADLAADQPTAYARSVVSGDTIAGPLVRAACRRHLDDLITGLDRGYVYKPEHAARVIRFFAKILTVETDVVNEDTGERENRAVPFILTSWQAFIVGSLFGWYRSTGFRRFRRAYTEIGKGNGKSPLGAGIGLYMMTTEGKLRGECYSAATDYDQAAIPFRDAVAMYERSPKLRFGPGALTANGVNPIWQLTHVKSGSFFKPVAANKKGKSGFRPYYALVDEVHEHPDDQVIEMLRAGTKGNQDALIFEITNSGFDRKSVCWNEHDYTAKVVAGIVDNDAWFGFIASLDETDDPFADESCWPKANPNLGVSIFPEFVREQVAEAKGMPSKEGLVRRLHFCQWTEGEVSAIPRHVWLANQAPQAVDAAELLDFSCYGGLDLSRVKDFCAFTLLWVVDPTPDRWTGISKTWFWTPADTLAERAKKDRAPYELWAKQGFIEAIPGVRIAYDWLADALGTLCARHNPLAIGADQYGLSNLAEHLDAKGIDLPVQIHPQGFQRRLLEKADTEEGEREDVDDVVLWMPDSINKFETALLEARLSIDPNPMMSLGAASVIYVQNHSGHRMFAKDKATGRIDGMVAHAMAVGIATLSDVRESSSAYNEPTKRVLVF